MTGMANTGRNDTCPCGSGKKFKRCCQEKLRTKNSYNILTMLVLIGALAAAVAAGISTLTRDSVPIPAGKVWSPEHGHYH